MDYDRRECGHLLHTSFGVRGFRLASGLFEFRRMVALFHGAPESLVVEPFGLWCGHVFHFGMHLGISKPCAILHNDGYFDFDYGLVSPDFGKL